MKTLLDIYDEVDANDIIVYEHKIGDRKSAIVKTDDWTAITVNRKLVQTECDEKSLMMHEMGHYHTNAYYNFESKFELKCRKEYRAQRWAVMHYLPLEELLDATHKGNTETYELAEYFDVTEEFIIAALDIYHRQGKI